jgi:hypothetical protein
VAIIIYLIPDPQAIKMTRRYADNSTRHYLPFHFDGPGHFEIEGIFKEFRCGHATREAFFVACLAKQGLLADRLPSAAAAAFISSFVRLRR